MTRCYVATSLPPRRAFCGGRLPTAIVTADSERAAMARLYETARVGERLTLEVVLTRPRRRVRLKRGRVVAAWSRP